MENLVKKEKKELQKRANRIRKLVIEMLSNAGSGHTAGSLGIADIFTALYFSVLNHKPDEPFWEDRDRVVLSNGHICPVLYATMAEVGYFPIEELMSLRRLGSRLQGHPHREYLPGIETTSGPLGCGLSQAVGMAIADRIDKKEKHFYCLLSDGEMNSGNTWEGGMLAAKEGLSNVISIMDRNGIQIDGNTKDVMPLEPLKDKWESWGWRVFDIDGHDMEQIVGALREAKEEKDKPSMIIANTTPGKGVGYIEGEYEWHGKTPNEEEAGKAMEDLERIDEEIERIEV